MGVKTIPELPLISAAGTAVNLACDDGIQSYRCTIGQISSTILATGNVTTPAIADANITLAKLASAVAEKLLPTGSFIPFGGTTAPTGYLLCNGNAVSRTTYSALFAVVGTSFGTGDGSTTFNLPNMQGLGLRGVGTQTLNGRTKTGPATVGAKQEDQMQKITGTYNIAANFSGDTSGTGALTASVGASSTFTGVANNTRTSATITFDSATSTSARVSSTNDGETQVSAMGANFIIKT